jgi:hypothetical protein
MQFMAERDFDLGTAGASARREMQRRQANREAKARAQHRHLSKLFLKFAERPQHERAWETGAVGEEQLAVSLSRRCPDVVLVHDRRMPSSRANIDHLAVAPSGVYVIDAKRVKGKIEVRKRHSGRQQLVVGGRDKSKLVEGLARQVEAVRAGLAVIEKEIPVQACFCFVNPAGQAGGSGIPLLRTLKIEEFELLYPRRLAKRLNKPGPLGAEEAEVVAEALVELFPAA